MSNESEFEKLLKESLANIKNILKEKSGKSSQIDETNSYHKVSVSHNDIYEDYDDIDFLHKKNGIQNKILNHLKNKELNFRTDEILDLHGLNVQDSEKEVNNFLSYHCDKNKKYLLIIHGKGTMSKENKAPIKKLVEKLMIASPHVLIACSANNKNGGRGATVILLKTNNKSDKF